jgi:hypothetical protein
MRIHPLNRGSPAVEAGETGISLVTAPSATTVTPLSRPAGGHAANENAAPYHGAALSAVYPQNCRDSLTVSSQLSEAQPAGE